MAEHGDNPFKLPPDDQIFLIREQERQKREEERERVKHLRVWEKTTASSRVRRNRRVEDGPDEPLPAAEVGTTRAESVGRETRREKENVSDFVQKKRDMFLVQMSLDVKKAEILKLDEKAKQKEEALKKSQQMLDEDVTRFDTFLQSNDQRAHKAMKNAEDLLKKKQDKIVRVKMLKTQLSAIQSEIAKHRELKDECIKYKGFLEKLTPQEWKEQKTQEKRERKLARKQAYVNAEMAKNNAAMQEEIAAEERLVEEKERESSKGRRPRRREAEEEQKEREREMEGRRRRIRRRYPTEEQVEESFQEISSGEEMPLYFEEPKQLLDVYTTLEESNLFLIQNHQDTDQALEDLDQKYAALRREGEAHTTKMKKNCADLERQIADEKEKCEVLRQQVAQKHGASEQEEMLAEIAVKVEEVHAACGQDSDHNPDTLQMLQVIEAKLEEYLSYMDEAEENGLDGFVKQLERQKENARRKTQRAQARANTEKKIEDRLKASLVRSQAPIHKKVGKQIMFRSAPLFQARRVVQEDDGYEEAMRDFDIFSIWIHKDGTPHTAAPDPI